MTIEPHYTYEPLISSLDPSFEEFYWIYEKSIDIRERKPRVQISDTTTKPDYKILLLKRNSVVVGFSILFCSTIESFCLLEYMAVHPSYRNLGLGRELFLHTVNDVASNCGAVPILLEVDSDREQSADLEIRKRRQCFYRRLGCRRIGGLSYVLPLRGEGLPPQMDLMIYFPGSFVLKRHQLEKWLKVIYKKVYNCSYDDPRILHMMEVIGDPVNLV